ncbi:MAG: hypothetical protein IKB02_09610 [Clostridia bacterium]|nr:hypothetical protein [Clostridia bacterium]
MDRVSAEDIGKKARALKHCIKVLGTIEKKGSAEIVLNCTGVKLVAHKNDALHLKIATTKAQLEEEIASYEIVRASGMGDTSSSPASSPPPLSPEQKVAERKAKKAAYMREYMKKRREAPATT